MDSDFDSDQEVGPPSHVPTEKLDQLGARKIQAIMADADSLIAKADARVVEAKESDVHSANPTTARHEESWLNVFKYTAKAMKVPLGPGTFLPDHDVGRKQS
ncbi:hypothetical protein PG996_002933 [Apiospora saccharicola]|uniref:Uncharacterized protein n=1 Tax=Apiospora saccharicola TaxID=335842 RepID=A0ABR1WKX8_9PEZI